MLAIGGAEIGRRYWRAMSQEKVTVARAFLDAYNARDTAAVDRLLHPDATITTLTARGGLGDHWKAGTTQQYFDQLDETWTDFRVDIKDYRELGERVVALGVQRGAGSSSRIEMTGEIAVVFVVIDSRILLVDTYDNWKDGLEAVGLSE